MITHEFCLPTSLGKDVTPPGLLLCLLEGLIFSNSKVFQVLKIQVSICSLGRG